jgi:hypothetical protein
MITPLPLKISLIFSSVFGFNIDYYFYKDTYYLQIIFVIFLLKIRFSLIIEMTYWINYDRLYSLMLIILFIHTVLVSANSNFGTQNQHLKGISLKNIIAY